MTDKLLRGSFSVFVSVAVKHFARTDGIDQLRSSITYYECASVFLPQLSGTQIASFLLRIILSFAACPAVPHLSTLPQKRHDFFWVGGLLNIKRVLLFFSRVFVCNPSIGS
jgi:hypothetical protein